MDPLPHEPFSDPVGLMCLAAQGGAVLIGVASGIIMRREMRDEVR